MSGSEPNASAASSSPVRPAARSAASVLALDVGGTKLAAGVVDEDGGVESFEVGPAGREDGPDAMIERLVALGWRALEAARTSMDAVVGVGIGCGGPLDPGRGVIHGTPNLPGWHEVPLGDQVRRAFGMPPVLENDATAAAMAEWRWGAGRGTRDLVYLTLSTGIGGGAIVDGRPVRGRSGNATELGHLSLSYDGWPCACGRRGCPEAFASGTNVARRAREALAAPGATSSLASLPGSPGTITAADVVDAATAGDPLATKVWTATTIVIGELVATALNAFDPDIVVLGGGLTGAGAMLLDPVTARARAVAMPPMRSTPIVLSALGSRVGVMGAAAVAFDRIRASQLVEA